MGRPVCGISVQTARFGGNRTYNVSVPFGQSPIPYQFLQRTPNLTESWDVSEILIQPGYVQVASNHRPMCDFQSEAVEMPSDLWRSNHYYDMLKARCSSCT